jgi:hypothetical protein
MKPNLSNDVAHWKNLSLDSIIEEIDGIVYREKWRTVKGYEGLYMVSNFGRVKSLGCTNHPVSIKSQRSPENGYLLVSMWKDNKEKKKLVHRLVAIAFVKNDYNKKTVNHKKGVKTDNRWLMLEWATQGENAKHAYTHLGRVGNATGKFGKLHPRSKPVIQLTLEGSFVERFDSISDAYRATGIEGNKICAVLKNKQKTTCGYKWKYA